MATFYKYKDRDDITKSMIDWSGITKDISDNLMKEKDRRDTLKAKIEEDQLEKLKAIDAYAKGLDPTMNQSMLKVAQNYKDYLLNSHKLMKQGLVSVADTKIQKQGAMDTFNGINDAVKGYNEKIGAIAEAGGTLNDYLASNIARALDISKSQLVIDEMGRGSFVTMDEDGNEIIIPATSLGTILNKKFNRFDTTGEVVNVVKGLGDWVKTSDAGYKSVSDLRERKEYTTILNAKVDEILNSEDRVVEAAADMMNMKITQDKNLYESEPDKYILSEMKGGKIKLSANRKAVSKRLYDHIDAAISRTEKEQPRPVERKSYGEEKGNREASSLYDLSNRVAAGDKVAFDQIEGRLYSITDEKGAKKQVKLSRPVLTNDNSIIIRDVNGKDVVNLPAGRESALAIANVIRSGDSADRVQSLFEQGERLSGGKSPSLRGKKEEGVTLVSALDEMPKNESKAVNWIKDKLPGDIEVAEADIFSNTSIRLTKGNDSKVFETSDTAGIKAWLDKYDATPMVVGNKKPKEVKRTIPQIMKEDGVSRVKAIKIFNNQ